MMDNDIVSNKPVTIEIVYELAADIGEHFKKLIEKHGEEPNESLVPCVVKVLELLEDVVIQRDSYVALVDKLQRQVEQLQKDNSERHQNQIKYLSEIEDIDESWRKENVQLSQYVKYLQTENSRLTTSIKSNEKFSHSLTDLKHGDDDDDDSGNEMNSIQSDKLIKNELDKLNAKIRLLTKENGRKDEEIEELQKQNDTLFSENQNLRNLLSRQNYCKNSGTNGNNNNNKSSIIKSSNSEDISNSSNSILLDRICKLEQELELLKLSQKQQQQQLTKQIEEVEETAIEALEDIKLEDLPVQGPIPKEPDEKLYYSPKYSRRSSNRSSRIWSFFPRLTRALIK